MENLFRPSLNRFVLPAIAVAVLLAAGVARADTYSDYALNFTLTSGGPAPTSPVSIILDDTTTAFTSFTVDWDGGTADFAGPVPGNTSYLDAFLAGGSWCGTGPGLVSPSSCGPLDFLFSFGGDALEIGLSPVTNATPEASGTYTVRPVPADEPGALLLLGAALLAGLWLGRRRIFADAGRD